MSLAELIQDALATLWRQKLRSSLTVGGVVVAIAALVALLSFASGMSRSVEDQVEKFSLLQTMSVSVDDSDTTAVLDSLALSWMATLPGVMQVFPQSPFSVNVVIGTDTVSTEAQAISPNSRGSIMYEHLQSGHIFEVDDTTQVLITNNLLDRFEIEDPDSLVGQPIVLFSTKGDPDSGFAAIRDSIFSLSSFDLLSMLPFREGGNTDSIASDVLGKAAAVFFEGYMTRLDTVRDTLIVSGIVDVGEGWADRLRPIILPERSARSLDPGSFSQNPLSMMNSLQNGNLFGVMTGGADDEIDRVSLELSIEANHEALVDSLEAHGFESSDFLEFYTEFRKMVLLFTAGMSFLGFIALFIAALGIVNTMVMSILERRREIGVLKSLGAEDKDIRILFLVESGTIGLAGSLLGLLVGWLGTEIVGFAMREYMRRQGIGDVDLFHLGPEVVLISIGFGLIVSMVAGLYPANRAAQLDPVVALREE